MLGYGDHQSFTGATRFQIYVGGFSVRVAYEECAFSTCFKVVLFPEAVGDNVLVQDYDLSLRVEHLKTKGIFNRIDAANSRAILNSVICLNALDHDHRSQPRCPLRAVGENLLKLRLRDDARILSHEVLFPGSFLPPSCDEDDTVANFILR